MIQIEAITDDGNSSGQDMEGGLPDKGSNWGETVRPCQKEKDLMAKLENWRIVGGELKRVTKESSASIQQEVERLDREASIKLPNETTGSGKVVPDSTEKESSFTDANADTTTGDKTTGSIPEKIGSTLKEVPASRETDKNSTMPDIVWNIQEKQSFLGEEPVS